MMLSVVGVIIYYFTDMFDNQQAPKYEPLQFQKLMNGNYEPRRFNGTWVSGKLNMNSHRNCSFIVSLTSSMIKTIFETFVNFLNQ